MCTICCCNPITSEPHRHTHKQRKKWNRTGATYHTWTEHERIETVSTRRNENKFFVVVRICVFVCVRDWLLDEIDKLSTHEKQWPRGNARNKQTRNGTNKGQTKSLQNVHTRIDYIILCSVGAVEQHRAASGRQIYKNNTAKLYDFEFAGQRRHTKTHTHTHTVTEACTQTHHQHSDRVAVWLVSHLATFASQPWLCERCMRMFRHSPNQTTKKTKHQRNT